MHPALLVALSVFVPFGCLGLLLFLAKLEDTLPNDVERSERSNVPEPILAIPLSEPMPAPPVAQPEPAPAAVEEATQRPGPVATPVTP
ncbi:MAG TPA: hypothetical protein VJ819_04695 [Nocardioidaceae bacterium]|nr:hypothetical protein [Nocardioidaceae bacterium]